jgi:DNA polymerase III subunit delta'
MSGLAPLVGHEDIRRSLGTAVEHGDLPGSVLLHGPVGIGKQRIALWLAQRLVCETPNGGEPCNRCRSCHLASHLEHPDVHWFFPLPRPKSSGSREKLGEALEEARAAELEVRRAEPYRAFLPGEPVGLYVSQMQILRRMAVTRPAMSKRKVFIIGAAESLVSQEASPEAANALLKVLEEPPTDTVFVLTSNDPDELLPTIRSRLLPIRVQPLSTDVVAAALREALSVNEAQAKLAARLSEGSIGRALAFLPSNGSPGQLEEVRTQARELLEAAVHPKPTDRLAAALAVGPAGARGVFTDTLDLLALWIRDLAAVASGAAELVVNIDATDRLLVMANQLPAASQGAPIALRSIDLARGMTRSNLNPQLTLAWLLREIGQALRPQF